MHQHTVGAVWAQGQICIAAKSPEQMGKARVAFPVVQQGAEGEKQPRKFVAEQDFECPPLAARSSL